MSKIISCTYEQATGPIDYGFTNDYMFRAILQQNTKVLTGLLSSLLHLEPEEITSIAVTNPIEPGDCIDNKEYILDVKVQVNHNTLLNLEMQVVNLLNWDDRSLSYLCRSYDQLCRGQDYAAALPVIHIGFLDYSPFKGSTEFYADYRLMNHKTGRIYSDKFSLRVVDLTQIDNATKEDKLHRIDHWARLFKATTWEEIKMMATTNEYLSEASRALFEMNADDIARQKSLARQDYMRLQNSIEKKMAELEQALAESTEALAESEKTITEKDEALAEKDAEIQRLKALLAGGRTES